VVVNANALQIYLLNRPFSVLQVVTMTSTIKGFTLHKMNWYLAKILVVIGQKQASK